jgi:hypothetical protein
MARHGPKRTSLGANLTQLPTSQFDRLRCAPLGWRIEKLRLLRRAQSQRGRARLRLFRGMLIATRVSAAMEGVGADRRFAASGMTSANYSR